ncbi:MAG: metallophosphoesterase [Myxococcales bacterium]
MIRTAAFALLVLAITVATHWIVYRWAIDVFPALARRRRWVFGVLVCAMVSQPIVWLLAARLHSDWLATVRAGLIFEQMVVVLGTIPLGLLRVVAWFTTKGWRKPAAEAPIQSAPMTRRQVVEGVGGTLLLGTAGGMLGWGMARGRHAFETTEVVVRIAGLPRVLDGYSIVQMSDIHTGIFIGEREIDEGFDRVRRLAPDLVVVTGDIVDHEARFAPLIGRKLVDLAPRDGVFAIVGNHDYYAGMSRVVDSLRAAGVDVLVNEGRRIRPEESGGFSLLGVDDLWGTRMGGQGPLLARAQAMVPRDVPQVLLSHQPATVDLWPGRVALQLSGHMHGGQINPGIHPAWWFFRYVAGRYEVGKTTLYVNRGFGTAGPPSRVCAPPEITRVVLVSA